MSLSSNIRMLFAIVFAVNWIFNGLIINCLQCFCFYLIRPININLYRKINYHLLYSSWSQVVTLAEYWAKCNLKIYFKDEQTRKHFSREHGLVIMNHKYEIDWLYCWLVVDKWNNLANSKSFVKKSLQWVPVIGWGWKFAEMIFLERQWDKDSLTLGQSLDRLIEYESSILLLMFAEGTRFTPDKYAASVEFANEKGLPQLKYHLQPRSRGFVFTVTHLKDKLPAIYNIQIAFPKSSKPTFTTVLKGNALDGHVYIERIPLSEINTNSEEEITKFLQKMYQDKDKLMDHFEHNNAFPGEPVTYKRRLLPLFYTLFWAALISTIFCYYIYKLIILRSFIFLTISIVCLLAAFISVLILIRTTKAKKGSSYGKGDDKTKLKSSSSIKRENGSNGYPNGLNELNISKDEIKKDR